MAIKAFNQDLCFLKALKEYEKVDATSSKASISKFVNHLWYLCEEAVMLSLFNDKVDSKTKTKMINNLNRDKNSDSAKRYVPSKEEITQNLFSKLNIFLFFSKYRGLVFAYLNCFFFLSYDAG